MGRKQVNVGGVLIGGGAAVTVQSMTNTDTRDYESTVRQIQRLEETGCEIVRVAVPDMDSAEAIGEIKKRIKIPLVADIHFDYRLAVRAAEAGADKIRINPGNFGENVRGVAEVCRRRGIPIRIGVNGGSLSKEILARYGGVTPQAMLDSAMEHIRLLHKFDFDDICISVKTSSVPQTIASYRLLHESTDYPLHLGVTESGVEYMGLIKSSIGIGTLLSEGIGDTLRVSLTAPPEKEVQAGNAILKALGQKKGYELISCPTCGRCKIDLIPIANEVSSRLEALGRDISVAVMGCIVNGPGEARQADYGIAGGDGVGAVFKKGVILKKVPADKLVEELFEVIKNGDDMG